MTYWLCKYICDFSSVCLSCCLSPCIAIRVLSKKNGMVEVSLFLYFFFLSFCHYVNFVCKQQQKNRKLVFMSCKFIMSITVSLSLSQPFAIRVDFLWLRICSYLLNIDTHTLKKIGFLIKRGCRGAVFLNSSISINDCVARKKGNHKHKTRFPYIFLEIFCPLSSQILHRFLFRSS